VRSRTERYSKKWRVGALLASPVVALVMLGALMQPSASAQGVQANYSATAGKVFATAVAPLAASNWFVTAVVNSAGDLEVITWYNNTSSSQIQRFGTFTAGAVAAMQYGPVLAVAPIASDRFVVALANSSSELELIVFAMDLVGNISRQGSV